MTLALARMGLLYPAAAQETASGRWAVTVPGVEEVSAEDTDVAMALNSAAETLESAIVRRLAEGRAVPMPAPTGTSLRLSLETSCRLTLAWLIRDVPGQEEALMRRCGWTRARIRRLWDPATPLLVTTVDDALLALNLPGSTPALPGIEAIMDRETLCSSPPIADETLPGSGPGRHGGHDGPTSVTITLDEYEQLRHASMDLATLLSLNSTLAARREPTPAHLVDRMLSGDSPIRVHREWRGLSIGATASAAGISNGRLRAMEEGRLTPDLGTLRRLADILDVTLDDLVPSREAAS
jgi:DNA-binding XRE family transcriptional regulator